MTYPSGRQVKTCYDTAGRPAQMQSGIATGAPYYASGIQYWPHGGVNLMTLGNGVLETTLYNPRLQPSSLAVTRNGANLLTLTYEDYGSSTAGANGGTSSNVGNVLRQGITPGTAAKINQVFLYDSLDRLTLAVEDPVTQAVCS